MVSKKGLDTATTTVCTTIRGEGFPNEKYEPEKWEG